MLIYKSKPHVRRLNRQESYTVGIEDPLTFDGEGCLHAGVDVVCYMAVEEPRSWSSCLHFNCLKGSREQAVDVSSMGVIRLKGL